MKGWSAVIVTYLVTLALWLGAKGVRPALSTAQALAQVTALLGIMSLAWNFVLAARLPKIEKWLGGLDRAYRMHHILGALAGILLLNHVAFLLIAGLPLNQLALYLVPGKILAYTLGQLAWYTMLFLLGLTLYVKLPYRFWKWTHEWMGLVIILGGLHSLLVTSDTNRYPLLGVWIGAWAALATAAYLYKRFLYYRLAPKAVYRVEKSGASKELQIVSLSAVSSPLSFGPGQYGFFSMAPHLRDEHPFSILGSEGKELIIGIKMEGEFTKRVRGLPRGAEITVRGPFGMFAQKAARAEHLVWIAGGIGITPFLSMARSASPRKKIEMYYCARQMPTPALIEPFEELSKRNPNFRWLPCETSKTGRLKANRVWEETGKDKAAYYLMCGPKGMMEDLAVQLSTLGVRRSHIIYEDFAFK